MTRYKSHRCGGRKSYNGPCGAPDCATCHPEWNRGGYYTELDDGEEWPDDDYDPNPGGVDLDREATR